MIIGSGDGDSSGDDNGSGGGDDDFQEYENDNLEWLLPDHDSFKHFSFKLTILLSIHDRGLKLYVPPKFSGS